MRRALQFSIVILIVAASPLQCGEGKQEILRSKHNFAAGSQAGIRSASEQRVCTFCHAPHSAKTSGALWSHNDSTVAEYGLYSSSTLQSPLVEPGRTDSSKLCLSCHDG